jgi:L-serine/L-threonine ammonia-lyase
MPLHLETPLILSDAFSTERRQVWLKLEALQPCGSFKLRGVGHACEAHARQGAKRLLSSSGGNAGLAVAYAGKRLGLPVLVVVPQTTAERPKALIREQGAELIVHGASWQEANDYLATLRRPTDAFVHPFDDPMLWEGHASMIDEVARQGPRPDVVVLAVGGGGLMSGVLQGLHRVGWTEVPVVAVETEGAASLQAAVRAGAPVTLDAVTSIATSLAARRVCDSAFQWTRRHSVTAVTVTDRQALDGCVAIADAHRLIVEPACGAALAGLLSDEVPVLREASTVLVIVCGGVGATAGDIAKWTARQVEGRSTGCLPFVAR